MINRYELKRCLGFAVLIGMGFVGGLSYGEAPRLPPTEHRGVSVESLGLLPESSLVAQVGLSGFVMQLREITLEPGGQIAKHSHAGRPGLVWTLSGSWTEGRADGERDYPATLKSAIVEDQHTEHWFWNDTAEPVRVVVCDIVPAQ